MVGKITDVDIRAGHGHLPRRSLLPRQQRALGIASFAVVHFADSTITDGGGGPRKLTPPIAILAKARDGKKLSAVEIQDFIAQWKEKKVADAQLGAFVMAVKLNGLEKFTIIRKAMAELKAAGFDINTKTHPAVLLTSNKIPLSLEETTGFIAGVVDGTVSDFDIGAWLMTVRLNGLTDDETAYLSEAMWKTGGEINLSKVKGVKCDKHAAGGSCDITSFIIAPLLAAFGIKVPMMSGRMLDHTGGTLDKLESIPGFNVSLNEASVIGKLQEIGLAIFGQMDTIAPADKKLYALRNLTGTVQSVPLIAASIISKKLAESADCLALVGTYGSGAFARNPEEAAALSKLMMKAAQTAGRKVVCFIVDMSQPLAPFVGPALEMKLAIRALKGQPDKRLDRLYEVSIAIAAQLLVMAGKYQPEEIETAKIALREKLRNGEALNKFQQMVIAQGGDPQVIGELKSLEDSPLFAQGQTRFEVRSTRAGYVQAIKANEIGNAVNNLGAGRTEQRPNIDHGVGAAELALVGDYVKKGGLLAVVYANDVQSARIAEAKIRKAYTIGQEKVDPPKLIHDIIV